MNCVNRKHSKEDNEKNANVKIGMQQPQPRHLHSFMVYSCNASLCAATMYEEKAQTGERGMGGKETGIAVEWRME